MDIVAEFYEGGSWCIHHRLWEDYEHAVESVVSIPMELWTALDTAGQDELRQAGVRYDILSQPKLSPARPSAPATTEEQPDERADTDTSGNAGAVPATGAGADDPDADRSTAPRERNPRGRGYPPDAIDDR